MNSLSNLINEIRTKHFTKFSSKDFIDNKLHNLLSKCYLELRSQDFENDIYLFTFISDKYNLELEFRLSECNRDMSVLILFKTKLGITKLYYKFNDAINNINTINTICDNKDSEFLNDLFTSMSNYIDI